MSSAGTATVEPSSLDERPPAQAVALLRHMRSRSSLVGWRGAVDEIRPYTEGLWAAAGIEERGRFLRHLRAWWDIHRHRIAPQVASRIHAMQQEGRLEIVAGKLVDVRPEEDGAAVLYRPRGRERIVTRSVRRIVNATGPQGDLLHTQEPLLRQVLARGLIVFDQ